LNTFGRHIRRGDYQAAPCANKGIREFVRPVLVENYEVSHATGPVLVPYESVEWWLLADAGTSPAIGVCRDIGGHSVRKTSDSKCYWNSGELLRGTAESVLWKEIVTAQPDVKVTIFLR